MENDSEQSPSTAKRKKSYTCEQRYEPRMLRKYICIIAMALQAADQCPKAWNDPDFPPGTEAGLEASIRLLRGLLRRGSKPTYKWVFEMRKKIHSVCERRARASKAVSHG